MNHELPDERLSAYLDGELSAEEAEQLEAELEADPSLRAELDRLNVVVSMLADEGPVRAPLGFHHAVMERVEREHPAAANTTWSATIEAAASTDATRRDAASNDANDQFSLISTRLVSAVLSAAT